MKREREGETKRERERERQRVSELPTGSCSNMTHESATGNKRIE